MPFGTVTESSDVLFDWEGRRKYVSVEEWRLFLSMAENAMPHARAFCRTLAFSGCRISEALALTVSHLDPATGCIVFRTLKRRKRVFRSVPVPRALIEELLSLAPVDGGRVWPWSRQTGWRCVKRVMEDAGIHGPQATAKGLRHGFGIAAAQENIPPGLTQRWMGHANLETTVIYQHAVGREEREFAQRLWRQ